MEQTTTTLLSGVFLENRKCKDRFFFFKVSGAGFLIGQHLQLLKPLLEAQGVVTAHVGELFYEVKEVNAFDYPDSATVTGNGLSDSVYKTFDNLWKNRVIMILVSCS